MRNMVRLIAAAALLMPLSSLHCAAESQKAKYVKVESLPFAWPNSDSEASRNLLKNPRISATSL